MGVYIKGMEMPIDPLHPIHATIYADGTVITGHGVGEFAKEAVPVPPHGDLIDRRELVKNDHQHYEYLCDEFYVTVRDIENAPTIIPAEPPKEEK